MSEGIRIRVRTNFAQNSKSITHEQTVEIDALVEVGFGKGGKDCLLVRVDNDYLEWEDVYKSLLGQAREVAAEELEARKLRFSAQVAA